MKNFILIPVLFLFPLIFVGQTIEGIEVVGSSTEGYIPVMKNKQWGIINLEGEKVIDFRSDLIYNETPGTGADLGVASLRFPALIDDRAIIRKIDNQIPYYGFIDSNGTTVIEPQFLNVSNFKNGLAFALKVEERFLGRNNLLDKTMKSYRYDVVLIDTSGEVKTYLAGPFPVNIDRKKLRVAPMIEAKWIGENLAAVKTPEKKWTIHKIE